MKTETTGTLVDGVVQLDGPIDLPNHCRVSVSVRPIEYDPEKAQSALESFLKRTEERPVHSGGVRFTRDELHERR